MAWWDSNGVSERRGERGRVGNPFRSLPFSFHGRRSKGDGDRWNGHRCPFPSSSTMEIRFGREREKDPSFDGMGSIPRPTERRRRRIPFPKGRSKGETPFPLFPLSLAQGMGTLRRRNGVKEARTRGRKTTRGAGARRRFLPLRFDTTTCQRCTLPRSRTLAFCKALLPSLRSPSAGGPLLLPCLSPCLALSFRNRSLAIPSLRRSCEIQPSTSIHRRFGEFERRRDGNLRTQGSQPNDTK